MTGSPGYRPRTLGFFRRSESGAVSVDGVLWMPVYVFFIALIVDTSTMFHSRSVALRIVEDANRHAVTGYLVNKEEVEAQVSTLVQRYSDRAEVEANWTDDDISTVVRIPGADLQPIGLLSILTDIEITVLAYNKFEI